MKEIERRLGLLKEGRELSGPNTKLGLVVEGGGMRGVVSGGALIAIERVGLTSVFDEVYGESARAINACYFLAGKAAFGGWIYLEDLTSFRFINPLRRGRTLDVDALIDEVMERRRHKPHQSDPPRPYSCKESQYEWSYPKRWMTVTAPVRPPSMPRLPTWRW